MKARIKFSKTGSMRFIGHLDVMRYFQKAMRRADIKVCYSQGFSPHQLMSFTSPLGIGLGSDAEYLDITLDETDTPQALTDRINAVLNDEIRVQGFTYIEDNAKPSMAALAACDYLIAVKPLRDTKLADKDFTRKQLECFLRQDKIEILKKTKKSEKLIDIRPHIYCITDSLEYFEDYTGRKLTGNEGFCIDSECNIILYCKLTAGSVTNIKPELVLEELCRYSGIVYNKFDYQVHRLEMYAEADGELIPMSEYQAFKVKDL